MFRRIIKNYAPKARYQARFLSSSNLLSQKIDKMTIDDNFDPKAVEEQIKKMKEQIAFEQEMQKNKEPEITFDEISKEELEKESKPEFTSESKIGSFKAETSKLLNIVAESLYSDAEVFIREFVANASDAIEKAQLDAGVDKDFMIQVRTDKENKTITFIDNGIGMNQQDVEELLGTIAKSGSKQFAIDAAASDNPDKSENIIGQFGVGFYSSFMVGEKVEVFTRKVGQDTGVYFVSDGISDFSTREITGCEEGTKIVITLKDKHERFSEADVVKGILDKNSNFSRHQIKLNTTNLEMRKPIWNLSKNELDDDKHKEFYQFLTNDKLSKPRWTLHYVTDTPVSIKSIFYVPEGQPSMYEVQKEESSSEGRSNIALYCKNVLIQKNSILVPRWLRFMRGVVDCEDIPLNLSREMLQDQALIKKLQNILTNRVIKLFMDKAKRRPDEYIKFFNDYKLYIVQGILEEENLTEKEYKATLLRYESSELPKGQFRSLKDYKNNMKSTQEHICYLYAPNRAHAEKSSYLEQLKRKGYEVLFAYDSYDDISFMQLNVFDGKKIESAENVCAQLIANNTGHNNNDSNEDFSDKIDTSSLDYINCENLASWATNEMAGDLQSVEITKNLDKQPAMITSVNLSMARYMARQQKMSRQTSSASDSVQDELADEIGDMKKMLRAKLLINPTHPLIIYAADQFESKPDKSKKILDHMLNWSMTSAGLIDDTKALLDHTNDLLLEIIEKNQSEPTEKIIEPQAEVKEDKKD